MMLPKKSEIMAESLAQRLGRRVFAVNYFCPVSTTMLVVFRQT